MLMLSKGIKSHKLKLNLVGVLGFRNKGLQGVRESGQLARSIKTSSRLLTSGSSRWKSDTELGDAHNSSELAKLESTKSIPLAWWEHYKPRNMLSRISRFFMPSVLPSNHSTSIKGGEAGGSLTNEEMAEAQDAFVVFMKGEDGQSLGTKELGALMRSMGQNLSEAELQEIMKVVNSPGIGGDPQLDFPGFMQSMVQNMEGTKLGKELRSVFKEIDKDGDGFVSAIELRQAIADMGAILTDADFEEMVSDARVGPNGLLNFEDFVKAMMAQSEFWG